MPTEWGLHSRFYFILTNVGNTTTAENKLESHVSVPLSRFNSSYCAVREDTNVAGLLQRFNFYRILFVGDTNDGGETGDDWRQISM